MIDVSILTNIAQGLTLSERYQSSFACGIGLSFGASYTDHRSATISGPAFCLTVRLSAISVNM